MSYMNIEFPEKDVFHAPFRIGRYGAVSGLTVCVCKMSNEDIRCLAGEGAFGPNWTLASPAANGHSEPNPSCLSLLTGNKLLN